MPLPARPSLGHWESTDKNTQVSRVADPNSFDTDPDPDPAFQAEQGTDPDPDPAFQAEQGTDPDPDPDPIWIQAFDDQKLYKKITAEKNLVFFDQKLQLTFAQAFIKTSKLQKKPSALKREHPALQT